MAKRKTTSKARVSKKNATVTEPVVKEFTPVTTTPVVKETPLIIMPEHILHQIKYLCKEIAAVEWSGILFYDVEGTIQDPSGMVFTLVDILPMHKGTQSYTEYEIGTDVMDYMMENPMLMTCKMGHIHSHNNMNVFFSGTDMEELRDNAPNHNVYLSLIVNNKMEFCAKVAHHIREVATDVKLVARDIDGEEYVISEDAGTNVINSVVVDYDCIIDAPKNEISVTDIFKSNVEKIIKAASRVVTTYRSNTGWNAYGTKHNSKNTAWNSQTKSWEPKDPVVAASTSNYGEDWSREWNKDAPVLPASMTPAGSMGVVRTQPTEKSILELSDTDRLVKDMAKSEKDWTIAVDDFSIALVSFTRNTEGYPFLESIIEEMETNGVIVTSLIQHITTKYKTFFKEYFSFYLVKENNPIIRQEFYSKVTASVVANFSYIIYTEDTYTTKVCRGVMEYLESQTAMKFEQ